MRLRTAYRPVRETRREAMLDGVALGGVIGFSLGTPVTLVLFWFQGLLGMLVVYFGAWVFAMTLWGRAFDFAFKIFYYLPPEDDDDSD